jgi:polar amino acid transport system substrate-binding protein
MGLGRSFAVLLPVALAVLGGRSAWAEPLVIGFIERPAYAWQQDGQAKGLLVDIARSIVTRAGIDHQFQAFPPKRVLKSVEEGREELCILGNFKTPEREAYAVFTKPVYQNKPIGILILKDRMDAFAPFKTLAELTASPTLRLGYIDGFSYGNAVDAFIAGMTGTKISRGTSQTGMVGMLASGRFDYMLADQEEYEELAKAAKIPPENVRLLTFPDVPEGNKRYLMCSKAVPRQTIERINAAIQP